LAAHRGREIPWSSVVKYHREIAIRAEQGFFQFNARDSDSDRWSNLPNYQLAGLAGPWKLPNSSLFSQSFRREHERGRHETLFVGGPCYWGVQRAYQGKWIPTWNPVLYREVELVLGEVEFDLRPLEGSWNINPQLIRAMDQHNVDISDSADQFLERIIENAEYRHREDGLALGDQIKKLLVSAVSELDQTLHGRQQDTQGWAISPSSWILFAPTKSFSAITRYLIDDYNRLDAHLTKDQNEIGGLRLLEDEGSYKVKKQKDPIPFVPLNDSQKQATKEILSERPLVVISGPPGCGKSQVVVATLLNAWAQGKKVLFASNNNQAVDVVKQRLEHFESEFPIAVRAGNRKRNNILEILRRTQNIVSADNAADENKSGEDVTNRRRSLTEEKRALEESLTSQIPQRIDESRQASLSSYAQYLRISADIDERLSALKDRQAQLEITSDSAEFITTAYTENYNWLERVPDYLRQIESDNTDRSIKQNQQIELEGERGRIANSVGLSEEGAGDWHWLIGAASPEQVEDWEAQFRSILSGDIEAALAAIDWQPDYDAWQNHAEADAYEAKARLFANDAARILADIAPILREIESQKLEMEEVRSSTLEMGIPNNIDASISDLDFWIRAFREVRSRESRAFDFVPWSRKNKLNKRLRLIARKIDFPLEIWNTVGVLDEKGIARVAPYVEQTLNWLDQRQKWENLSEQVANAESTFEQLRVRARELNAPRIPRDSHLDSWQDVVNYCRERAGLAAEAAIAWARNEENQQARSRLRAIADNWSTMSSGVPIWEAWLSGQGQEYGEVVESLRDNPTQSDVVFGRTLIHRGVLSQFLNKWKDCVERQAQIKRIESEILAIPELREHLTTWWSEKPDSQFLYRRKPSNFPQVEDHADRLGVIEKWIDEYNQFIDTDKPRQEAEAKSELDRAIEQLGNALDNIPTKRTKKKVQKILDDITEDINSEWPLESINELLSSFRRDGMNSRIQQIDVELERSSFEEAKSKWRKRLLVDDDAMQALGKLERTIHRNKGQLADKDYESFQEVLRAVPVWITTAQAAQAIPLMPELFDIVVIDEASQCTLTNLLPLIYRGKTLAVIGDEQQLPAIPHITPLEDQTLGAKFDVSDYLDVVGHCSNDVYRAATDSLPRRRADVLFLDEHHRSHPQIIGFANRYIYQYRLKLKKDQESNGRLPVASGVFRHNVIGTAERGPGGRSWMNRAEGAEVIKLVLSIKNGDAKSLSLGVVTPFAPQKNWLNKQLESHSLQSEVLVDSAHGFQGDEREIMIFSPVIARGITGSACKWVESPPNLVNVALTRAKYVLHVVADLEFCKQQDGVLRSLAMYVDDIETLRQTSPAELELFSWMMVENMQPKVHPRIGDVEVDFVVTTTSGEQVAIEVDGAEHHEHRPTMDNARDAMLQSHGYRVVRVPAREIFETPYNILEKIR